MLGPAPVERQLDHSLALVEVLRAALAWRGPHPADRGVPRLADLGSGGGIPGLVVAAAFRTATIALVESQLRRARFLERAVGRLGAHGRCRVLHERAEVLGRTECRGSFDAVTARSFGPPGVTAECAAPLLRLGGALVVADAPPAQAGEGGDPRTPVPRWPVEGLALLGMAPSTAVRGPYGFRVIVQGAPCPERYPRRVGIPRKRPLF